MKFIKWLMTRTIILYIVLFAVSFALVDYTAIKNRITIRTLNHNMPENGFNYLIGLGEGQANVPIEEDTLKSYVRYYEKVVNYLPKLADAHGMLGFSYYYLNEPEKALKEYEKAGVLNPHFFFFQYNLGVIHFLRGDYAKAAGYFETARQKKAELALLAIKSGIEYQRALLGVTNLGELIMVKMKSAYTECYRLLVVSHLKQQHYKEVAAFSKEAIGLGLGHPEIFYYYAGVAAHHLKEYETSVHLLGQDIAIDPEYAEA